MTREKRLEKAQLRVLFNTPFFAPGVARLPVEWDESIPTACTQGTKILWNPKWFDSLKDEEIPTVLCEEVGHCLFGHIWRSPPNCDHTTWNIACDCAVRNMMAEFGELLKSKGLAEPFPFPEAQPGTFYFPHKPYAGMCEEKVYSLLAQQGSPQSSQSNKKGSGQGKGGKSGSQGQPGSGNGNSGAGQQPNGPPPPFAEFETSKNASSAAEQKQANNWKNVLIQSVHMSKGRGDCPPGIQRMVNELLNPAVPWQEVLRNLLREMANDDWDWMKPEIALSDATGFILPSLNSEKVGAVVFAIDTSGSIDQHLLAAFKCEEQYCLDDMKPAKLREICCDAAIHSDREFRQGDQVAADAPGGGGTDFRPVFNKLAQDTEPPKCVVYLTDLGGTFPSEEPPYPVIWIVYNSDKKAPFGETVKV